MGYFNLKQVILLLIVLICSKGYSQQNILFTYEPFDYTSDIPLNGQNGGQGWQSSWQITSYDAANPGYSIGSPGTYMPVNNLEVQGSYAKGGYSYKNAGRMLNLNYYGNYINDLGIIGKNGSTIYMSIVLRKEVANDNTAMIATNINANPYDVTPFKFGFGYTGNACNSGSNRYWGIALGSACYPSNVPVIYGASTLIVAKITFGATNTISLFINPSIGGGIEPSTANVTQTTTADISFKNIRLSAGGSETNQASFDEIRIGSSFLSVVPTATDAGQVTGGGPISGTSTWNIGGNTLGTAASFIGSTDATDLKFKTNNQDRLTVTKDGYFGVGTTVPLRAIHLKSENATLRLERNSNVTSASYMGIDFVPAGTASAANVTWGTGVAPSSSNYSIWSYDGVANSDRLIVTKDGNIGIGTTNPNSKVVVKENDDAMSINSVALGFNRNVQDGTIFNASKSAWQLSARDGMFTLEGYNGAQVNSLTVIRNGNVGIGSAISNPPTQKLDVTGNIVADGFALSRNNTLRGSLWFANTGDKNHRLYNNGNNQDTEGIWDGMKWNVQKGLIIRTGDQTYNEVFRLGDDGNVGIGIANVKDRLHVNGNILLEASNKVRFGGDQSGEYIFSNRTSNDIRIGTGSSDRVIIENGGTMRVNGRIISKDIKITSIPLTDNFPDYVFKKGYKLMTLDSLSQYIVTNKHLPEIPSAKQVKDAGGLELGEMNVMLLKKVEELTLYVLQLNEEVQSLRTKGKK